MGRTAPRFTTWALLSAATLSICTNISCEKLESESSQSERHVDEVARQALEKEEAQQPDLYGQAATDVAGKSDVATARARQLQAQAEYNAGTEMMRLASNQASQLAMQMIDIDHLISTIETSNALVSGYSQYDAGPIQKEARAEVTQIEGSSDQGAWVPGKNPVPTISAVKQTISQLEGEIRQKEDQAESLNKQRVAALRRSEDLNEQADKATGPAWVSLYKQASGLRKKAADISTQIDNVNSSIEPLRTDLAIAQSQLQIAQSAVVGIRDQAAGAEQNFAQIRKSAHDQDTVVRDVYTNAAAAKKNGDASLRAQLEALIDQYRQVQTSWDSAAKLLADAAQHFGDAQTAAESLQVNLDQRAVQIQKDIPEKQAWDQLKHVYSATMFQYDRGVALQALGMLYTDQLATLQQLSQLKARTTATLSKAKLEVPSGISSADFDSAITKATDSGKDAFTKADDLFQNVSNAPLASAEQQNGGRVARILELYGWYQLGVLTGDAQAPTHLSAARDAIKDAIDHNATLPILPVEIAPKLPVPPGFAGAPAAQAGGQSAMVSGTPADAATVASIKQSINDAVSAMQAGDAAKIKQFLIVPPEMSGSLDSMVNVMVSSAKLQKSITAKFGAQAAAQLGGGAGMDMPTPDEIDAMMTKAKFTSTGSDTVAMNVAGSPETMMLRKNGNGWALDLGAMLKDQPQAAAMMPMMSRIFQPMADVMNQLASDVDARKYQNVNEVKVAMQQKMMPIIAQAMSAAANQNMASAPTTAPAVR